MTETTTETVEAPDPEAPIGDLIAALGEDQAPVSAPPSPRADAVEAPGMESELPMDPDDDLESVEGGEVSDRFVSIVESLLFAAKGPLRVREIRKLLKEPTKRQVQLALKRIVAVYEDRGLVLQQVAGGFRFSTHPNNASWVQRLLAGRPARLSRSQLEALAVVAYRQPITKAEIDHVRGVDCSAVLRLLLDRELTKIVGRKEEPGRPHLYGTTVKFLEFFNLKSLRDLPDLREFRELNDESRATLRESMGDVVADEVEIMGQEVMAFDGTDDEAPGDEAPGDEAPGDEEDPA